MTTRDSKDSVRLERRTFLTAALGSTAVLAADVACGSPVGVAPVTGRRRFENKVVLVTGATSGIGRAAAIAFAAEGGKVAFCGRRENLGQEVEQLIRQAGGEATYYKVDVRDADAVRTFVDTVVQHYGGLHVAFNNAGISMAKGLHDISLEEWNDLSDTNVRGVFAAMRAQIPHMLSGGGGSIVVTSSVQAFATRKGSSAYTASKRALVGIIQAAALEYGTQGIRVNALCPGTVDTPLVRRQMGAENMPEEQFQEAAAAWARVNVHGQQRLATAAEVADAALMLACDDHPYLTGSAFVIDGGMTLAL
ncbi:SDR family oxidoreductase [Myxococcus sp. CA051A]|uniref:SDR family NAD(P)-dependent oxidoreductase n=1 Tax=unclassified Myxococcus TaxID=2648731 RepID=UPI00157AF960|nr:MULTISPECIES: SDR family oxidoreductase [unclassified Myxococcus]NTX37321.1 SDR family oxidoreductase [Myxococcus sp. CA033]NTX66131.1 SDR family oxidoreductase [Myxococcus sp. CA051A]